MAFVRTMSKGDLYKRNVTDAKFGPKYGGKNRIDVLSPCDVDADEWGFTTSYQRADDLYCDERYTCLALDDEGGRKAAWEFFHDHLHRSAPLKIGGWTKFREEGRASSSFLDRRGRLPKSHEALVASMPADALEAAVTVQAKPLVEDADDSGCKICRGRSVGQDGVDAEPTEAEICRHNRHVVDSKLTIAPVYEGDERNIFYGQEDQVTAQMELGDVLRGKIDPRRKICVAQETIFSNRNDPGNADGGDEEDSEGEEDEENKSYTKVSITNDGRCIPSTDGTQNPAPLAMLLPWIRLPSFLLPTDDGEIEVKEINFWMCPEECRTNTHYDGHHNLLMVLSGTKTVELSPPGTFRGSPVHGDHANHPFLLRCTQVGGHLVDDHFDYHTGPFAEGAKYNNIVVSVTAGEAVFIPEGWWHRVESSDNCAAINVWFDYQRSSVSAISHEENQHMLPYQARDMVRRYLDANIEKVNEERARVAYVQLLGRQGFDLGGWRRDPGRALKCFLESMEYGRLVPSERSNEEIHRGLQVIERYSHHLLGLLDESQRADSRRIPSLRQLATSPGARSLGLMISFFLALLDPKENRDRIAMVSLFDRFPPVHTHEKRQIFTDIVKGITQEACYNLSVAWEKHTPIEQAQASYGSVFGRCVGDEGRRYFMAQIDDFRNESARKLILADLMLLNPEVSR